MNEIIKEFRELTSQLYIKLIKIFTFEQHGKRYFGVKYNGKTDLLRYEGVVKELEAIYEKQEQFLLTKLKEERIKTLEEVDREVKNSFDETISLVDLDLIINNLKN